MAYIMDMLSGRRETGQVQNSQGQEGFLLGKEAKVTCEEQASMPRRKFERRFHSKPRGAGFRSRPKFRRNGVRKSLSIIPKGSILSLFWSEPRKRRTKRSKGKTAYRKGGIGETKASKFLRRRGYKSVVEGRLRTGAGEFDRIMRSPQGRKVAVEVKNLASPVQGSSVRRFGRKVRKEKRHGMVSGGVLVSKSGFSPEAKRAAREEHVKLIKYAPPKKKRRSLFGW